MVIVFALICLELTMLYSILQQTFDPHFTPCNSLRSMIVCDSASGSQAWYLRV